MSHWPYHAYDEIEAVRRVLMSGKTNYWNGEHGKKFEEEFADYTGAQHALTCSNGTAALELALAALNKSSGEVIVPCRTFFATASAVVYAGFTPVLADIDAKTLNVNINTLEARRTKNTVGVVVVHYAGFPVDMESVCYWAKNNNLFVVEDCAHAHGSRISEQHVGTFGDIGCFSFCVGKTMSTGGEGGMVITDNPDHHKKMAARRDHGRYNFGESKDTTKFQYTVEKWGTNLRMTELQSVIGRIQLTKLDLWTKRRNEIASLYDEVLGTYQKRLNFYSGRYMYMNLIDNRDERLAALQSAGIAARTGGCPNIGKEKVFAGWPEIAHPCPVADAVDEHTISLPCYPTMTDSEVEDAVKKVKQICV